MATLLKSDGTQVQNVSISTLEKMQRLVGGYIEFVYIEDGKILVVNEDALFEDLPYNEQASAMCDAILFGDVILTSDQEMRSL